MVLMPLCLLQVCLAFSRGSGRRTAFDDIPAWRRFRLRACRAALGALAACGAWATAGFGQTVSLDFNTTGQYTNNFNPWNDSSGTNGGVYCFTENPAIGVGGGGGVAVFQSTDTTAAFKSESWDFSTNGATVILSVLLKANSLTSANKLQFGVLNSNTNGLNSNAGVTFESYRFVPTNAAAWSLREQYRTGTTSTETVLGGVTVTAGHWYKFVIGLTNTSGAPGSYTAGCALYDYGVSGLTPGANLITFPTVQSHSGQDIAQTSKVWPALRAFQNAGIDARDDFLVYTTNSLPVITLGLTNMTEPTGQPASFYALADGPGAIAYSWFTNGMLAVGESGSVYTTPPLNNSYTNVMVQAANYNGTATSSASLTVLDPPPVTNMVPVAVSGFNRDVVVENSAAGPPYTNSAQEFNAGEGTAFYQNGLPGKSYGLPASGLFTSALGDGTVFQLQPYTAKERPGIESRYGTDQRDAHLDDPDDLQPHCCHCQLWERQQRGRSQSDATLQ